MSKNDAKDMYHSDSRLGRSFISISQRAVSVSDALKTTSIAVDNKKHEVHIFGCSPELVLN